jgi:UDP-N-acetylglucosamine--N-acetylmuramyl-(pentapeptide) pyrophosphoryl-undecaprenol N-acetylglucosamine transferase
MFPLKLADSLWKAKQIIKEFKPDVVIERVVLPADHY